MTDFSGIYESNFQNQLMFLDFTPPAKGELLSSLQSFETSLMMIALGRWTNAITSITNSIETLIKADLGGGDKLDILINDFCDRHNISSALKDAAHRVRKKRNDFIHSAVIPDDNDEAILTYMNDALSVLKVFLEKSLGINLYEAFASETLSNNLVFIKNITKSKTELSNVGMYMSVLVKTVANSIHHMLTPEQMFYTPDESNSWDAFDHLQKQKSDLEDTFFKDGDFIHDLVKCPAVCGGHLSVLFDIKLGMDDFKKYPICMASCPKCGLLIIPKELIHEYVTRKIPKEEFEEIMKSFLG